MVVTQLILASRSPQRVKLMRDAGYVFECDPADIDEEAYPQSLTPEGIARWLALEKARAVARRHPGAVVLGADTVVALDQHLLGKPEDEAHARQMLKLMSGTVQQVITGVALVGTDARLERVEHAISLVHMREMTEAEIDAYVATGDWRGKAGGYGIQDHDPFVTCTDGSISNVIGLPMELVAEMIGRPR